MKEETIKKLLELGFEDKTYSVDNPRFELSVNEFSLLCENGKFTLEGNGGYDDHGSMDLDHLQIEDIRPLYKLLTGNVLTEKEVSFNYEEWQEKLKRDAEQREENFKRLFPNGLWGHLGKFPKQSDVGFLDFLQNSSNETSDKFVWQEDKKTDISEEEN